MRKRYRVTLTAEEREALGHMISRGKAAARRLVHARVLLQADASAGGPDWTDTRIAEAVRVSVRTIERVYAIAWSFWRHAHQTAAQQPI